MKKLNLSVLLLVVFVLAGCGGSDGNPNPDSNKGLIPPKHIEVIK
ncbi:hypothetical protein [uncultured Gammaproteobacteria bacterium]|nr:hypothetical protein BROOK1789B_1258 [Bathymodiolus brooksi thiotrophic gill symbiont]CAC9530871.1 hypothetical protein [uncultured Gammaproteobacteria bacterium]CAB9543397.1 hypothetical protein BROOK1789C_914 [Bathymodiolus brooksi thiotrophic gill symbiont]CAC9537499.1 hypothetical protein [uncultured Gammaproteobacteria bacterium]CAC9548476.1 hypothetical protein [uncultured Gammaproteobacteria bacterium]